MSLAHLVNHQIRLAARPVGMPTAANWSHTTEAVAEPADGGERIITFGTRRNTYIINPEGKLVDLTTGEDPSFFTRLADFLQ